MKHVFSSLLLSLFLVLPAAAQRTEVVRAFSTGGNGSADANKTVIFGSGGSIRGETLLSDGLIKIGDVSVGASVDPGLNLGRTLNLTGNAHGVADISQLSPVQYSTVTGVASTDVVTSATSAFTTGDVVTFSTVTGGSGLSARTAYYVRQASGATFKLATTNSDGTIVNFTTDITAGVIGYRYGYNSYDALVTVGSAGAGMFDHYAAYQARPIFNAAYAGTDAYGYWSGPTITAGFTNTQYTHFFVQDAAGAGSLDYQRGLYIGNMTKGSFQASIVSAGSAVRMLHAGPVAIGSSSYSAVQSTAALTLAGSTPRLFLTNTTEPATPTGGGIFWVEGGALKYKGSAGTVSTLAVP